MKYSGAEIIIKLLEQQGITIVAGIPGGSNLPLYDALAKSNIRHILSRHEQGAGFIAQGMARSTGKTAVCFATSGPGVVNLLTAIADAKMDSVPLVAITGQVASTLIGTDAFQEIDTYGLTLPITKHNFLVRSAHELLHIIPEAFKIAISGRPGPVVIDVPKDIQMQIIDIPSWSVPVEFTNAPYIDKMLIDQVVRHVHQAQRPLLFIGGGIIHAGASQQLKALAHKTSIPVVTTLNGLGVIADNDPLFMGMVGMHGTRATSELLDECDLLLAFGVRFDDRATGKVHDFVPNATIIHADIDKSEFNKIKKAHISIQGNILDILTMLHEHLPETSRPEWVSTAQEKKALYHFSTKNEPDPLHPCNVIRAVGSLVAPDTIITTDVGQHQMWVAQLYPFAQPRTLLTSGGLGTMGFGLPAAIGAALANPHKRIVCFTGDGSLLMNIQELATLSDHNLNVTIILFNNGHLGLVRQQQELFYAKNYIASKFLSNTDFTSIAQGFGINSHTVTSGEICTSVLSKALTCEGQSLVNILIDHEYNVFPMVPPGAANRDLIGG
jgi:acetolactate synthase-1/2/3 large subunit